MGSPPKNSPPDCFSPLLLFGSNKYFAAPSRRSQFALSFAPLTRIASKNYIRAASVILAIVKSFGQAFSKACGFQRQSLWQVFKGGALNNQSPRSYCKPKLHSRGRRLCAGALNSRFQNKISYAKCYLT